MPHPLNVAVIGLGAVAVRRHLPVLADHPHFKIASACETDPSRAAQVAREFSIPMVSPDARAVLESDAVDVVAILTPPSTHASLAHQALDAGKHVLIEKPLAINVEEAEQLAARAERASSKFLVAFNQRHHPLLQRARAILRAGQLGKLRAASAFLGNTHSRTSQSGWHADPAHGGDLLFEVGVHHFDALRFLLEAEVSELYARETETGDGMGTLITQMQFTNDMLVTTTLAEQTLEHNAFDITGDKGKLILSLYRFDGIKLIPRGAYDGSIGLRLAGIRGTLGTLPGAVSTLRRGGDYALTYRAEWDHFYEVIQNDAPPLATAQDGLKATRIAHAARQSVLRHAPVCL
jgi:predicted dehydrogenase